MITNMATNIRFDLGIPAAAEAERARKAAWIDGLKGLGGLSGLGFASVNSQGEIAYCDDPGMEEATPGRDCIVRNVDRTVRTMGPAPPPGSVIGPGGNTIVPGYGYGGVPMNTSPNGVKPATFDDQTSKLILAAGFAVVALMALRS